MPQDIAIFQVGSHSDALLPDGTVLSRVHSPEKCAGRPCVIHKPSDHHMREWPIHVRMAGGVILFERICTHRTGHPDPDQEDFWSEIGREDLTQHGCCGCCATPAPPDA